MIILDAGFETDSTYIETDTDTATDSSGHPGQSLNDDDIAKPLHKTRSLHTVQTRQEKTTKSYTLSSNQNLSKPRHSFSQSLSQLVHQRTRKSTGNLLSASKKPPAVNPLAVVSAQSLQVNSLRFGPLARRTGGLFPWRNYWAGIKHCHILLYDHIKDTLPTWIINLKGYQIKINMASRRKEKCFMLTSPKRKTITVSPHQKSHI